VQLDLYTQIILSVLSVYQSANKSICNNDTEWKIKIKTCVIKIFLINIKKLKKRDTQHKNFNFLSHQASSFQSECVYAFSNLLLPILRQLHIHRLKHVFMFFANRISGS
jgi:hypothetical protein